MPPPGSGGMIPDDLVREILIRLPVKSLMRFKCVSKVWLSIITDPSFAKDYQSGFRGLLITGPNEQDLAPKTSFFYASLDGDTSEVCHHLTVNHGNQRMRYTNVVNGLVCFYDCYHSYLYNIASRESLQLPLSTYEVEDCSYHFGYDPVNKLYKLLKLHPFCGISLEVFDPDIDPDYAAFLGMRYNLKIEWCKLRDPDYAVFVRTKYNLKDDYAAPCEILTIGVDSSWRIIDSPPMKIKHQCVCFSGILYWTKQKGMRDRDDDEQQLLAFDLAQEKFQLIPPPTGEWRGYYLSRFGPSLALISIRPCTDRYLALILHCYNDGVGREHGWMWAGRPKFNLPLSDLCDPFLVGILPSGKALIIDYSPDKSYPPPLYLLDLINREYEMILLHITPSLSSLLNQGGMFYHEENIMQLKSLTSTA